MVQKIIFCIALGWGSVINVVGQELNCQVSVLADKIQISDKKVFKSLETAITDFMNNTQWTNEEFSMGERIECGIQITVDEYTLPGNFKGKIQVTSTRPIYNTGYKTSLVNFQDKNFTFSFLENTPIFFTPDQFKSNLSSVLAFYAYYILGMDFDSFGELSGTKYFQQAQRVVNNAQNASESGWKSYEDTRNRYWMVENILQKIFEPLRKATYEYHRLGMDKMSENVEEARKTIFSALKKVEEVNNVRALPLNNQMFFNAKMDELIGIYSEAPRAEKEEFVKLMRTLDPTHLSKYNDIL